MNQGSKNQKVILHTIPKGNDRFTGRVSRHYTEKIQRFDSNTHMILEDFIVKNISSASQDTPCALIIFFKLMIDTRLKVETSLGHVCKSIR